MFRGTSSGGSSGLGLGDPTFGWAYQDFASIAGTSVTLTANDNGTSAPFSVPDIISSSAFIVRAADTDTVPYSGVTKLFSTQVKVTAHTADAITLNAIPDASWGSLRIYYLYQYSTFPVNYTLAPKFIRHSVLSEIDALFITHEELLSANIGTSGIGPFASYSGTTAQFYKLNSLSSSLTIALDAINNKIDFTSTALVSPLTTRGDLLGMNPSGTHIRIPIGASGRFLQSDATDAAWSAYSLPLTVGTASTYIRSDGTNWVNSAITIPNTAGTTGQIWRSNGTNTAFSTSTFADTYAQGDLLHASAANTVTGLTIGANNTILRSNGTIPVWSTAATIAALIDHGLLLGLSDDDHTQYLFLSGRAGGQIAIGGTNNGDNLSLRSTSGGTKGKIIFGTAGISAYLDTVDNVGFGTNAPSARLHINGTADAVQSIFEAHSTQTTDLMQFHSSASAVLSGITGDGRFGHASGTSLTSLGLFFYSDTNCGWYLSAADDIVLSVGGQTFMRFDENGATSDIIVNEGQSQHRWKWYSANDGVGNFYIDGGGDRIFCGLGETPSLAGTAYKLSIQVGQIRDNFGALQLYHSPTNSTASIVAPTFYSNFYFEQDTAAAKTLTNSNWEHVFSAVTDNAGATLTLGTAGNKAMYELTFNPTQTTGTLTYPDFRAIQYQRNLNGAGVTEQWDVNNVGITRNRYCGITPIATALAPAADTFTVNFGANQASPDTNYSVQLTGRWTTYTLLALGKPFPGGGWIYIKAVLYGASKATTGFTGYAEYQVIDAADNLLYVSGNNYGVIESEILAHHAGADTVVLTDTSYIYVEWLVRRYY